MRRHIDEEQEHRALDWLDEQDSDFSISMDMVFAKRGRLSSKSRIIDIVTEARIRGARLSECADYLDIDPCTIQRWKLQRQRAINGLSDLLRKLENDVAGKS